MDYAQTIDRRISFAFDSPDFWRGIIIALAVLTVIMVVRVLYLTLRHPGMSPTQNRTWAQAAGLMSYGILATVVGSIAFDRLGDLDYTTWRLAASVVAIFLGIVWAFGTLRIRFMPRFRNRKPKE